MVRRPRDVAPPTASILPREDAAGRFSGLVGIVTSQGTFDTNVRDSCRLQPGELWRPLVMPGDTYAPIVILPKERDPRLVTIRRGGTLSDSDHRLHALWAAVCAEHVLHFFESECPSDTRPRDAVDAVRAWTRGELKMLDCRAAGGHAMGAARPLTGAARYAAYAAGQAACVAHVAEHNLGAAAYAIKAARAGAPGDADLAGRVECEWQRDQLPAAIREVVIEDQRRRNDICWHTFVF